MTPDSGQSRPSVPSTGESLSSTVSQLVEVLDDLREVILGIDRQLYLERPTGREQRGFGEVSRSSQNSGTIGAQVRHLLDHVRVLVTADSSLCYTDRDRGSLVETSQEAALEEITKLRTGAAALASRSSRATVSVIDAAGPVDRIVECRVDSTWAREVLFVVSHSVHHLALIRLMAQSHGHWLEDRIGRAASTRFLDDAAPRSDRVD